MSSNLLNSIGLGDLDIGYLFLGFAGAILLLLLFIVIQMVQVKKLKKKYRSFMLGKDGKSLEKEIIGMFEDNRFLKVTTENNKKDIRKIYKNLEITYQKVGIVKYDAFKQMGGLLSFSLALLNDKNNGFIINSVHSTDGCYSYTKEIKNGDSEISLGEEEKKALEIAINCNNKENRS